MSEEKKTPDREIEDPAEENRLTQEMIDRTFTPEEQEEWIKAMEEIAEAIAEWKEEKKKLSGEELERLERIKKKFYWG